jgi:hypothetical protein
LRGGPFGAVGVFEAVPGDEDLPVAAFPVGFFSAGWPAAPIFDEAGLADWATHALARQ